MTRSAVAALAFAALLPGAQSMPGVDEFAAGTLREAGVTDEWLVRHMAMLETESNYEILATSPYAKGLAQFTDPTRGDWWPRVPGCEDRIDHPFDPICNILAMRAYMRWLVKMSLSMGLGEDQAVVMAQRGYNGGFGWQQREYRLCQATPGCDPHSWRDLVEICRAAGRSEAACRENGHYPVKIAKAARKKGWKRKLLKAGKLGAKAAAAAGVPGASLAEGAVRQATRRRRQP